MGHTAYIKKRRSSRGCIVKGSRQLLPETADEQYDDDKGGCHFLPIFRLQIA